MFDRDTGEEKRGQGDTDSEDALEEGENTIGSRKGSEKEEDSAETVTLRRETDCKQKVLSADGLYCVLES